MKKFHISIKKKFLIWVAAIAIIVIVIAFLRNGLLFFGFISYGKNSVISEFRKNKDSFTEFAIAISEYVQTNDLDGCSIWYDSGVFSEKKIDFHVRNGRTGTEQEIDHKIKNLSQKIFNIMYYQSIVADSDGQILFRLPGDQGIAYLPYGGYINSNIVVYSQPIGGKWYYFEEKYVRVNDMKG